MTVAVAVPDSPEGQAALEAGIAEAQRINTRLVVVNLALQDLDSSLLPSRTETTVVTRKGEDGRDPVDVVLAAVTEHSVSRLVIGLRRRSPVGKALLGSVSQRLLLESPVPVLTVKTPD